MGKGLYIVIEGLDGSGKSTIATKLVQYLKDIKSDRSMGRINIHHRKEPSHTGYGLRMRNILETKTELTEADEIELAQLMLLDRIENTTTITGLLRDGDIVIQERNFLTALAYNEAGDTEMVKFIQDLNRETLKPDLLLFVDVSLSILKDRLTNRGEAADAYEKPELLEKRYIGYYDNKEYIHETMPNENLEQQDAIIVYLKNEVNIYLDTIDF